MTTTFLCAVLALSVIALTPLLYPLLASTQATSQARALRRQAKALAAARDAGALSQDEYARKLSELPVAPDTHAPRAAWLALALAIAVPITAIFLYRDIGEPRALDPSARVATAAEAPDLATAVKGLEARLAKEPEDANGLRLLATAYQKLQRFTDARDVLAKVRTLVPQDLDVQVEYAEALALAADDKRFAGEAETLLIDGLARNPDHQRALWLSGIAAVQRDDKATARTHWQRLLTLLPPESSVHRAVAEQLRALDPASSPASVDKDTSATASGALQVQVRIDPNVQDQVSPGDTVFVIVRANDGSPMPIAVQRMSVDQLPARVTLDDRASLMPTRKLSEVSGIIVTARVSKSGDAMARPGDLASSDLGVDRSANENEVELVIDHVLP